MIEFNSLGKKQQELSLLSLKKQIQDLVSALKQKEIQITRIKAGMENLRRLGSVAEIATNNEKILRLETEIQELVFELNRFQNVLKGRNL